MNRFARGLLLFGSALTGLSLAVSAQAQIKKIGSTYQFRAQYVKGSTIAFDMSTQVTPFGGPAANSSQLITLPVVMRILDIRKPAKPPGTRIAKIQSTAGPIKLNGKPFKEKTVETVFVDQLNRLQQDSAQDTPQFTTPLPEKRLKVGESWTSVIDPSESVPFPMRVKATYKLLKVDQTFSHVSISLEGRGTGTSGISTKGQGTMMLRNRDGTLHSLSMTQTVYATGSMGAKTTITVKRRV